MVSINRALVPLKIILFCWYGAAACLLPYMTIHMKQLGITVKETALVYTLLPVTQIIATPLAGFIADRMGKYKPVLMMSLVFCIVGSTAIMFVPSSGDPNQTIEKNLLDATTIVMSEAHKSSYGRQRIWPILATGLFSPICGWLVDASSKGKDEFSTNYTPTFHFFNALVFITIITLFILNIEVAPPPPNIWKNIKPLLKSLKIWVFLIVVFILGACWGFVESFLFWYLLDLKAPKYLLGLTLTTGAITGLPFLHTSEWFVKKAGHVNLMILALIFYLIRFGGYSLIHSPWWCIPFEAMEAFTYHLMWCAAATYSAKLAPPGLIATFQGVVGGLHYGVGRGAGSMIGGSLMALFGARQAFRVIGIFAGIIAIVYSFLHYCFLRDKEDTGTEIPEKPPLTITINEPDQESNITKQLSEMQNGNVKAESKEEDKVQEISTLLTVESAEVRQRRASGSSITSNVSVHRGLDYQL